MLEITVDLHPYGNRNLTEQLSQFVIWNTGTKVDGDLTLYRIGKTPTDPDSLTFTHKRDDGVHTCVMKGLQTAIKMGLDKF